MLRRMSPLPQAARTVSSPQKGPQASAEDTMKTKMLCMLSAGRYYSFVDEYQVSAHL